MLTKDKKPDEKEGGKEAIQVMPPRPDTPRMFKAALEVSEQAGLEDTWAKMKKIYKPCEASASSSPVPPPSPMHRRSPVPRPAVRDDDDTVSETSDSTLIIRMTAHHEGDELLSVELAPGEQDGGPGATAKEKKEYHLELTGIGAGVTSPPLKETDALCPSQSFEG